MGVAMSFVKRFIGAENLPTRPFGPANLVIAKRRLLAIHGGGAS